MNDFLRERETCQIAFFLKKKPGELLTLRIKCSACSSQGLQSSTEDELSLSADEQDHNRNLSQPHTHALSNVYLRYNKKSWSRSYVFVL